MAVLQRWDGPMPSHCRGCFVTIGNFDGVHRGHQSLLATARATADRHQVGLTVLTFDPHPLALLAPARLPPALTTAEERSRLLLACGAAGVVVLATTPALLNLSAEEFFQRLLVEGLAARGIVEGWNFRFGRDRRGTNSLLAELCRANGMLFREIAPQIESGEPISSSRIRAALSDGALETANELLGRCYALVGTVEVGAQRGRTIGFPTANLGRIATLVPAEGVYACRAILPDGTIRAAATNIGPNPTFAEHTRKIEIHLLDFAGNLYDVELRVEFVARLRAVRRFAGIDDLREQLQIDIAQARQILSRE